MQQDDRVFAVVGASVLAAVALIAALVWLSTGIAVDPPQRVSVARIDRPTPEKAASAVVERDAVDRASAPDGENDLVRAAAARLSAHPRFAAWLVSDGLLRRFVATVDAVAGGYSPSQQLEFMRPVRPFLVREEAGALVIASGSYRRYDTIAEIVQSLDIEGAVALYRRFAPQLEAMYAEVGWSSDTFDGRFRAAVDHLLEVTLEDEGPLEVEQRAIVYAYADERLEELTDAQKQLLRMGPDNVRRVTSKLRELRRAMGWPEPEPEPEPEPAPAMVAAGLEPLDVPEEAAGQVAAEAVAAMSVEPEVDRVGAPAVH